MTRFVSTQAMLEQCEGLIDTKDLSDRENDFITSVVDRYRYEKKRVDWLSDLQREWLERIWQKHFA